MAIYLNKSWDLRTAVRNAQHPVTFLVGSPLSKDQGGGVPGIDGIVGLVRNEVITRDQSTDKTALKRFDAFVNNKTAAHRYQAAMTWLNGNFSQDAVNTVIRNSVLKARLYDAPGDFQFDGQPSEWYLPEGTKQLANLIKSDIKRFSGPILTTNFDPLLSLALLNIGVRSRLRVIDQDGALPANVEIQQDVVDVVHLHGYWRDADTLNNNLQLVNPRAALTASLRNLLRNKTLIVIAYGGWDDAFTKALSEVVMDTSAKFDVLWCFRDNDPSIVAERYSRLIEKVLPAIIRGRFRAYGGIDCHSIFAEIVGDQTVELLKPIVQVPNGPVESTVSTVEEFDDTADEAKRLATSRVFHRMCNAQTAFDELMRPSFADLHQSNPDPELVVNLVRAIEAFNHSFDESTKALDGALVSCVKKAFKLLAVDGYDAKKPMNAESWIATQGKSHSWLGIPALAKMFETLNFAFDEGMFYAGAFGWRSAFPDVIVPRTVEAKKLEINFESKMKNPVLAITTAYESCVNLVSKSDQPLSAGEFLLMASQGKPFEFEDSNGSRYQALRVLRDLEHATSLITKAEVKLLTANIAYCLRKQYWFIRHTG